MAVNLSSLAGATAQFFDNNGVPLAGGLIYTYVAGTTTPAATYTSSTGVTAHANPIVLDAAGRIATGEVWLTSGVDYKFLVKTSANVQLGSYDNIPSINDFTSIYADLANTTNVALGDALVGFKQSNASGVLSNAVGRTVHQKLQETVSVMDFGAVGDGSNDDTAAIQAALNTGKYVYLPKGTYKTTSTLNVTIDSTGMYGEGQSSLIQPSFVSGDIFAIGDGSNQISELNFNNFLIWPSVVKTSGYAFNCRFITSSTWTNVFVGSLNVYVTHRLYDGFYFDRFGECKVSGGQIIVAETGIKARGNSDQTFGAELSFSDSLRIVDATKGIWIGGACGGIYLNRMDVSQCTNGAYFDDTLQPGVQNREIFFSPGCTIDSSKEWGIIFRANGGAVVQANGLWLANSGTALATAGGALIESTGSFAWSNLICYYNKYDGINITAGAHNFSGGYIRNSGTGASGGNGITATGFAFLSITGMAIHNNGNVTRGYGVDLVGTPNNFIIEANIFFSNGQGQVYSVNSTLTQMIRDNSGYVSENSSYATILTGNSTVVVNHGLSDIPTFVEVGFAGPMDAGSVYVYVQTSSFTSTQFTITYSAVAGANRVFWWRATRGQA